MKKRLFAMGLVLVLCVCVTACAAQADDGAVTTTTATEAGTTTTTATATATEVGTTTTATTTTKAGMVVTTTTKPTVTIPVRMPSPETLGCYSVFKEKNVELTLDEKEVIVNAINTLSWKTDHYKCASGYIFYYDGKELYYHEGCGTVNDNVNNKAAKFSEDQRKAIDAVLGVGNTTKERTTEKVTTIPTVCEKTTKPATTTTGVTTATSSLFTYVVVDGEAVITGMTALAKGDVIIPSTVDGYTVTVIGEGAFYECTDMTSVTFPATLKDIRTEAFWGCSSLRTLKFPNQLETIRESAFSHCESVEDISFPLSLKVIEQNAFYRCIALKNVHYVGSQMDFIPVDLDKTGNSRLSGATWHYSTVTTTRATWSAEKVADGYRYKTYDGEAMIIKAPQSLSGDVVIPSKLDGYPVNMIGSYAFEKISGMTSVVVPNGVVMIDESAFWSCENLLTVFLPSSVTDVRHGTFVGCESLTAIIVEQGNKEYLSQDGILFNKAKTAIVVYPAGKTVSEYQIPDGVTSIGANCFSSCKYLTNVTIPSGVTSIGRSAFSLCNFTSITLPYGIKEIDEYAFSSCEKLESIILPDSITYIGGGAFASCESLKSIVIPNGVTQIASRTFGWCRNLTSVTVPDGVKYIGNLAFAYCDSLQTIELPDSVIGIVQQAFLGCGLVEFTVPRGVTTIEKDTFRECKSLTSVTIHVGVGRISDNAFYDCRSLLDVYYGGSEQEWEKVFDVGLANKTDAKIHYNVK